MIDMYKVEPFIDTLLFDWPITFPIQQFNTPANELEAQFQDFFSIFDHIDVISDELINNAIELFVVPMWNLIYAGQSPISTESLYQSFFCPSLFLTIEEVLKSNPKGDRQLKSYLWTLSTVIRLEPSLFDSDVIQLIFRILVEFSTFKITLLHCLLCFHSLASIDKFDDFFFSTLDDFLSVAKSFESSQAIKLTNEFLLKLSQKEKLDEMNLIKIAQFIIFYVTNPIQNYDFDFTIDFINSFISISETHQRIIAENGFFDCFPEICEHLKNSSTHNIKLILNLTNSSFSFESMSDPFILRKIIDIFSLKICDGIESQKIESLQFLDQVFSNLSKSQQTFINFLNAFKSSIIIQKLCSYLSTHSFKFKEEIRSFLYNLIRLQDERIILGIIENHGLDKIIENDDLDDPDLLLSILETCMKSLTDEQHKEYVLQVIENVKEMIED